MKRGLGLLNCLWVVNWSIFTQAFLMEKKIVSEGRTKSPEDITRSQGELGSIQVTFSASGVGALIMVPGWISELL